MKLIFFCLILFIDMLFADFEINNQAEVHWKYQDLGFGLNDNLIYLRLEKAQILPRDWQLYLRVDIPYLFLWGKQTQIVAIDIDGVVDEKKTYLKKMKVKVNEHGLSDLLTRAFFVTPPFGNQDRVTFGFGSEFLFPSAQKPELGTGKYSARPMVGMKWDLPKFGNGGWAAILFKYQFSFAGKKCRPSFQIFFIQPVLIYPFANGWTLSMTPEYQMTVATKKWFVPFSLALGKSFTDHFSASLQYQRGIVTSFPVFKQEVEIVIRYVF